MPARRTAASLIPTATTRRACLGKHSADAGTCNHIQDFPIALHVPRIHLRRKELTGARHFRIEHGGSDDKGHAIYPLQAEIVVSILSNEPVVEGHRLAE